MALRQMKLQAGRLLDAVGNGAWMDKSDRCELFSHPIPTDLFLSISASKAVTLNTQP